MHGFITHIGAQSGKRDEVVRATMRTLYFFALLPLVLGCARPIGQTELLSQMRSQHPPTIVDVRSRGEFESAHVPGAVHIPFYSILGRLEELPEPRESEEPLVVYCEHGPRAGLARAQLWFVTDRPIRFLEGHMTAWKKEGRPVETVQSGLR